MFENIEVWNRTIAIIDKVFEVADRLVEKKKFQFAEQHRSDCLSIANNIAEGSASSSKREFKQFLSATHRTVSKTAHMIIISQRGKFIDYNNKIHSLNQFRGRTSYSMLTAHNFQLNIQDYLCIH